MLIVPLKKTLAGLSENKRVQVAGNGWSPPHLLSDILQSDGRHPTVVGLCMIAALCLETLIERGLGSGSEVDLDTTAAARAVLGP